MTETMLERATLAVFKAGFHPDDAADEALIAQKRVEWPDDWRRAKRNARAVLEAMREPTEAMYRADEEICRAAMLSHGLPSGFGKGEKGHAPGRIWRAMVDAALTEAPSR